MVLEEAVIEGSDFMYRFSISHKGMSQLFYVNKQYLPKNKMSVLHFPFLYSSCKGIER